TVRRVPACRSTKSNARCDAPPAYVFLLSRADSRTPAGKPWSRSSSDSLDRCAPPLAMEGQDLLPNGSLSRSWDYQLSKVPHFSRQGGWRRLSFYPSPPPRKVAPYSYFERLTYVTFSSNVWMRVRSTACTYLRSRLREFVVVSSPFCVRQGAFGHRIRANVKGHAQCTIEVRA